MELDAVARLVAIERSGVLLAVRQEGFGEVCKRAGKGLDADCAQLNVVTDTQQVYVAEWPKPRFWRQPVPLSNSGCREVVLAERSLAVDDAQLHEVMCLMPWTQDWRGYLGAPVIFEGQILGTLCVVTKQPRVWTAHEIMVLEGFARQVSDAL